MSIKSFGKQSFVYGFGHIIARLVTFLLLPFYTNIFSTTEYGIISLAYAFIGFAGILFHYGMDTALMKFYISADLDKKIGVFSSIWLLQFITSFIFVLIITLLSPYITNLVLGEIASADILVLVAIILALDVVWKIPILLFRANNQPYKFVIYNLFNVISTISGTYYFVVSLDLGVKGVFIGNIFASGLMVVILFKTIINNFNFKKISLKLLNQILKFGIPFVPAGIFTMIMELSDRYLLEWIISTSSVGIYSTGYKFGMFGLLLVMGFNMAWTPFFLKHEKNENAPELFSRISAYFLGIYGLVTITISVFVYDIIRLDFGLFTLIGESFWPSTRIVPVICISYYFFGLYVLQLPAIYFPEKTKLVPLFRGIGAFVNIGLNIMLIPFYGILGAAWATVIAQFIMVLVTYIKTHKLYKIPFSIISIVLPLLFLLGSTIISENGLTLKIVYIIFYLFFWYFIVLKPMQREPVYKL